MVKKSLIKPPPPPRLFMAAPALDDMVREFSRFLHQGLECGGHLLGKFIEGGAVILYSTPTGPNAQQSRTGLTTDVGFQRACFLAAGKACPEMDIQNLGNPHLHPFPMPVLSGTDHAAIRDILFDPEAKDLPFLCVLLMHVTGRGALGLKSFVAMRGRQGRGVAVQEVPLEVLPLEHPLVRHVLKGKPYVPMAHILASMHPQIEAMGKSWVPDGFSRMLRATRERIRQEEEELAEAGWTTLQRESDGELQVLHGSLREYQCSFLFPPEYPLNGPTFIYRESDRADFREFRYRFPWNSLSSPKDIVDLFLEEHPHAAEPARATAGIPDASPGIVRNGRGIPSPEADRWSHGFV